MFIICQPYGCFDVRCFEGHWTHYRPAWITAPAVHSNWIATWLKDHWTPDTMASSTASHWREWCYTREVVARLRRAHVMGSDLHAWIQIEAGDSKRMGELEFYMGLKFLIDLPMN